MILSRNYASRFLLGALVTPLTAFSVTAGDYSDGPPVDRIPSTPIADHCAQFGPGFVDAGNGVCRRVSAHVRVYVGDQNASLSAPSLSSPSLNSPMNTWATNGASSATLRSDGMVPGAEVTHLRVRGSLESYDPFR